MKADHTVEYQISEYDDTFFFTESYEEARAYFEEGRVVYEAHISSESRMDNDLHDRVTRMAIISRRI